MSWSFPGGGGGSGGSFDATASSESELVSALNSSSICSVLVTEDITLTADAPVHRDTHKAVFVSCLKTLAMGDNRFTTGDGSGSGNRFELRAVSGRANVTFAPTGSGAMITAAGVNHFFMDAIDWNNSAAIADTPVASPNMNQDFQRCLVDAGNAEKAGIHASLAFMNVDQMRVDNCEIRSGGNSCFRALFQEGNQAPEQALWVRGCFFNGTATGWDGGTGNYAIEIESQLCNVSDCYFQKTGGSGRFSIEGKSTNLSFDSGSDSTEVRLQDATNVAGATNLRPFTSSRWSHFSSCSFASGFATDNIPNFKLTDSDIDGSLIRSGNCNQVKIKNCRIFVEIDLSGDDIQLDGVITEGGDIKVEGDGCAVVKCSAGSRLVGGGDNYKIEIGATSNDCTVRDCWTDDPGGVLDNGTATFLENNKTF